ncbi:MAG: leucine--tRNA ligase, partial [Micrococcales bacterium]|nr:leucine--tRNA ligase [Micrococcales bacterium]
DMWQLLGHEPAVALAGFGTVDQSLLVEQSTVAVVQVDGKLRDKFEVDLSITDAELEAMAMASAAVQRTIEGKEVVNVIVRAPKLVNIATK